MTNPGHVTTYWPNGNLQYSTGLCSYILFKQEITNLKKAPQMFLNSTSCQNVYVCVFLAMYSTEINVTNVWSNF